MNLKATDIKLTNLFHVRL